jgi:RelB antitoxin
MPMADCMNTRIDTTLKKKALNVFGRLGVSEGEAIRLLYAQVEWHQGIPLDRLPGALGVRPCLGWRISQGGIGFWSAHNPRLACGASSSRAPKLLFFEYCRYHHARPARSSARLTFVPSGNTTSATVRPCGPG